MQATPECFAHLTQLLQVLAGGRVCAVLEVTGGEGGSLAGCQGAVRGGLLYAAGRPAWAGGAPVRSQPCPVVSVSSLLPGRLPSGVAVSVRVHGGEGAAG